MSGVDAELCLYAKLNDVFSALGNTASFLRGKKKKKVEMLRWFLDVSEERYRTSFLSTPSSGVPYSVMWFVVVCTVFVL